MPKPRRIVRELRLDRVDLVGAGACHDLETNEGTFIELLKRADVQASSAPAGVTIPFGRETIQKLIDTQVAKITASMPTLAITKENNHMSSRFAEELNAWDNRSYEDEGRIVLAIMKKAQRITKSEGGSKAPHEVIEEELFAHATNIAQRDGITKGAALEKACREFPVLRAAANEARHHLHSLLANE